MGIGMGGSTVYGVWCYGWKRIRKLGMERRQASMGWEMYVDTIRYGFVITDCMAWERESIELFR
jgi:hypothetical protein